MYPNQRKPKNTGWVSFKTTLPVLWNLSCVFGCGSLTEMDCNLKTMHQADVFKFFLCLWKNRPKLAAVCSSFENIIWIPSFDILGVFRVRKNFSTLFAQTQKAPRSLYIYLRKSCLLRNMRLVRVKSYVDSFLDQCHENIVYLTETHLVCKQDSQCLPPPLSNCRHDL